MIDKEKFKKRIIKEIEIEDEISDDKTTEIIANHLRKELYKGNIDTADFIDLSKEFFNSFRKLDMLQDLVDDKSIDEIMINGPSSIFIEKNGQVIKTEYTISSEEKLLDLIQRIVGEKNKVVNELNPIVDTRLSNGSRVNVVIPPISGGGPVVTIRKFPEKRIISNDLINNGSISKNAMNFLTKLIEAKYNIFISGGTGTGKTTLLNVLSDFIPRDERIIVIEDTMELQITNIPNIVRLEARSPNNEGVGRISIRDLIIASLRMRPDRIIVGEVRGPECIDMLQALNTGHEGSISTGHANSTKDMIFRLETMVMMAIDLPLNAIRRQIASGLDIIVHLKRMKDGTRKVFEISEILDFDDKSKNIEFNTIYKYEGYYDLDKQKVIGELKYVKELKNKSKLEKMGINITY